MNGTRAVKRRIRYELYVMGLLVLTSGAIWHWQQTENTTFMGEQFISETYETAGLQEADDDWLAGSVPFEWKEGEFVRVAYGEDTSNHIDPSRLTNPANKNAADLAIWAQMAWENQWGYVWGTFGQVLDETGLQQRIEMYGEAVTEYEQIIREKWMGRRAVDCAGLIKSYAWYDPAQDGIYYNWGDMADCGTDGLYENAPAKGPIDTLPERPGLLVYAPGHVGVYVGEGYVIEAISHAGGVVKTKVADRTWTDWLECPSIQYD